MEEETMAAFEMSSPQTYPWRLLGLNALITLAILLILEFWRPYFFLTDDNLDCALPGLTEIGRHLGHGESPFVSRYIFNGNYHLLRDISYLNWHPLYLAASLLANFPASGKFAIIDAACWVLFILTTTGFTTLALYLREAYRLKLTDGQITLFATSYTWSIYALITSCCWFTYAGSLSALPWLALGAFQKNTRAGLLIITLATIHAILGGHPEPLVTSTATLTLLVLGISFSRKSLKPLLVWIGGNILGVMAVSPFLIPAIGGYLHTTRGGGLSLDDISTQTTPALSLLVGYFLGPWAHAFGNPPTVFSGTQFYLSSLAGCFASWCIFFTFKRSIAWTPLHFTCAGIVFLLVLLIARPLGINELIIHVPVFSSIRWPFRETLQFIFFIHLFLVLRSQPFTPVEKTIAGAGVLAFTLGLCPLWAAPPTFNALSADRTIILTGIGDRYWNEVTPLLDPTAPILSATTVDLIQFANNVPYPLIASMNYGDLFAVKNYYGYSSTAPADQIPIFPHIVFNMGDVYQQPDIKAIFTPHSIEAVQKANPNQKFNIILLTSLRPPVLTLTKPDGTVIDLVPMVEKAMGQSPP
jgi:hypothetical protein